ncbi:phosphatase PAP2 family protein [Vallitalea longa]|uniref:Phosphatase PAP2 family protein n=1 Tax=Vallitalea longa TaxID=2936439 RepID=A0A9W5YFA2_9FIRM|nr:phosphatase PAP2 family protein [Vallitalea longa]GKX31994.1 phosphatase PAP2 family protein [Vallitalea longa]
MIIINVINQVDQNIILYIFNHLRTPILDDIMTFFSSIGDYFSIWIIICILLMISKKYRTVGFIVAMVLLTNTIIGELILKNAIGRVRPYDALNLDIVIKQLSSYSMPSGHALSSFSVAFVVLYLVKQWKIYVPVLILAIAITLSRVYLSVHYPTDVLLSVLIAFIVSTVAIKIGKKKGLINGKY